MTETESTIVVLDRLGKRRKALLPSYRRGVISAAEVVYWHIEHSDVVVMFKERFCIGMPNSVPEQYLLRGFELLSALAERYPKVRTKLAEPM